MFAKLLKHEWRATRGVIALLCVIILISGLTIGSAASFMLRAESASGNTIMHYDSRYGSTALPEEDEGMSDSTMVLCVLLVMAGVIAIAVCTAASLFFVIYRFYKRCFTDEGYLTFTLPVNNHQILLSSITNCIFCELLTFVAAAAAAAIIGGMFLLALNSTQTIVWADVWVSWEEVWQQLVDSFRKNADQLALAGFSSIVGSFSELILLMVAVTIGALIARKHKILAAVGVYYGIGMVQSFVMSMVMLNATTSENVNALLASPGIMGLTLSVCGYFLMHWLISKKLNLA